MFGFLEIWKYSNFFMNDFCIFFKMKDILIFDFIFKNYI